MKMEEIGPAFGLLKKKEMEKKEMKKMENAFLNQI
jgi:hypothetical protein